MNYHGDLTFTYPKLDEIWKVSVDGNGIDCDGKKFPYLFWEGEIEQLSFNSSKEGVIDGELIKGAETVIFLEKKLDELSFNDKEKTDFITFWAPRMISSNFVMIQFILDQEYESQIEL